MKIKAIQELKNDRTGIKNKPMGTRIDGAKELCSPRSIIGDLALINAFLFQ